MSNQSVFTFTILNFNIPPSCGIPGISILDISKGSTLGFIKSSSTTVFVENVTMGIPTVDLFITNKFKKVQKAYADFNYAMSQLENRLAY